MTGHPDFTEKLAEYAAGRLTREQRAAIDQHLAGCRECRAELALWRMAAEEIISANRDLVAPAGLADRVGGEAGLFERLWTLVRVQIPLVRRELFPASAALMLLGAGLAVAARRAGVFYFLAPMIAAGSLAAIYNRSSDPAMELVIATPTSPWKILLARMLLVSSYNLLLALAASAVLCALLPAGLFATVVFGWLAPLMFLSALALVISMWSGTGQAMVIAYAAWMANWMPFRDGFWAGYRQFWGNSALLCAGSALLLTAALWSAGRSVRPDARPEAAA